MVNPDDRTGMSGRQRTQVESRPSPSPAATSVRRKWREWVPYVAGGWSLVYGALGVYWTGGGAGFPFGGDEPARQFSILGGVRPEEGAPVIAVLGLTGAVVATLMAAARPVRTRFFRIALMAFAWAAAAFLLVVVPDARALVAVAYAPVVLLGAPFGWPPEGDYRDAIPWPVINQFICIAGGFAWAATALAFQHRTRPGGRHGAAPWWTRPEEAARWGRWATGIAAFIPLVYATTRAAWAVGIPLGITEEFLRQGQTEGTWGAGASLASVAVVGAILTTGLAQPWGEVFPRWIPGLGGKRVPPALAIVPATIVAILVTNAGLTFWRRALVETGTFALLGGNWAALGPELLWPLWGVALGVATLAYYLRRGRPAAEARR